MEVGDRLLAVAPADVRVHRPALDRARPDQRHLDDEVVELPRLEPGQRGHLRPRLDLEHADGVGPAQHLVDLVLLGDRRQVDLVAAVLADQVDGVVQRRQHPQPEQVELHQPAAAQSSLSHCSTERSSIRPHSTGHTSITGRSQMTIPPEWMPRCRGASSTCSGQLETRRRDPVLGLLRRRRHGAPPVDPLGPGVLLARRVAERLGHVAHRRLGAVGDHVGDLRRVVAAVLGVDVLDDLLAPVALDVDVDVRRAVALGRQEALEQQAERHGVGGGDAEGVADRRVGGAAPALAEDVGLPAEAHEVPHDEEVAGEAELLDDRQLVVDRPPGERVGALAVALPGAVLDEAAEVLHLASHRPRRGTGTAAATGRRATGRTPPPGRSRRPARRRRGSGRSGGAARRPSAGGRRPPPAATGRARRGCCAPARRRGPSPAGAGPAWRSGRWWWRRSRRRCGRRARRGRRCGPSRAGRRGPTARRARGRARTPRPAGAARGGRRPGRRRRAPRHGALAAAGEHPHVPGRGAGDVAERELRRALLPRQVPEAERAGEAGVAVGPVGEQQEVVAVGVGGVAVGHPAGVHLGQRVGLVADVTRCSGDEAGRERDLGAEHGRHPDGAGRLGEADDAVEAVVVGQGEGLEAEAGGLGGQLLGVRRPVEEGEVGVAVQLGVGHRCRCAARRRRPRTAGAAGSTPVRHRRRSTTGCPAPARRDRVPESAASSSLHVHDGLLKPTAPVSNACPPNASSLPSSVYADRHDTATGSADTVMEVGSRPGLPERRSPTLLLDARRRQQLDGPLPVTERRRQQPEATIRPCRSTPPRAAPSPCRCRARASASSDSASVASWAAKATAVAPTATCPHVIAARTSSCGSSTRRAAMSPTTSSRPASAHASPNAASSDGDASSATPAPRASPAAAAHSPLRNSRSSCCASAVLPATSTPSCRPVRAACSIAARGFAAARSPARWPHRAPAATTGSRAGASAWRCWAMASRTSTTSATVPSTHAWRELSSNNAASADRSPRGLGRSDRNSSNDSPGRGRARSR